MYTRLSFIALLVASPLAAQDIVSPAHWALAESYSYGSGGFGTTASPSKLLSVHDDMQGVTRTIRGVSFRRDGSFTTDYAAFNTLVKVWVSTALTTAATTDATFANNHGPDKQQVANFALVQFPPTVHNGLHEQFEYSIPFTTPVNWTGGGSLCLEIEIHSRTNNFNVYLDYVNSTQGTNPAPAHRNYGTGCKLTGNTSAMSLTSNSSATWSGNSVTLGYSGRYMPAPGVVTLLIGGRNDMFLGIPLPVELPGTSSAPSGSCMVYNEQLLAIPALSDSNGRLTQNLGLRVDPSFNGLSIFTQVAAIDAAANRYGVVVTGGVEHHVVAPWTLTPMSIVYASSLATTGTLRLNRGYVTRFDT